MKKKGKMSRAKYILFFNLLMLCKFCSNWSTNKKFSKKWVGPLNSIDYVCFDQVVYMYIFVFIYIPFF